MKKQMLFILVAAMLLTFLTGCTTQPEPTVGPTEQPTAAPTEAPRPSETESTPTGEAPTDPPSTTEPEPEPTLPGNVPAEAAQQSDGTYLLRENVDLSGNPVSDDAVPAYVHQIIYDDTGKPVRDELVRYEAGTCYAETMWEYDAQNTCTAVNYTQYFSTGDIQLKYRETYDAAGRPTERTDYGKGGVLTKSHFWSYNDNGKLTSEVEYNEAGTMLSKKEYYEDGIVQSATVWQDDGIMRSYNEYDPSGKIKYSKYWRETGLPETELTVFDNGSGNMRITYGEDGNMTSRSVTGNPDGSADISEFWLEDGTYQKWTYSDRDKGILEFEEYFPDGSYHKEFQNEEEDWVRIINHELKSNGNTNNGDSTWRISTGLPIEGYVENTTDDGIYTYIEWKDSYKYCEIWDGVTSAAGYMRRVTTYFYPNGTTKSGECYYYHDGGRTYYEYDENGNETYFEDTTICE